MQEKEALSDQPASRVLHHHPEPRGPHQHGPHQVAQRTLRLPHNQGSVLVLQKPQGGRPGSAEPQGEEAARGAGGEREAEGPLTAEEALEILDQALAVEDGDPLVADLLFLLEHVYLMTSRTTGSILAWRNADDRGDSKAANKYRLQTNRYAEKAAKFIHATKGKLDL